MCVTYAQVMHNVYCVDMRVNIVSKYIRLSLSIAHTSVKAADVAKLLPLNKRRVPASMAQVT